MNNPAVASGIRLQLPQGEVVYSEWGQGPPIVLLPGAGHDRHDFDALASELSIDYRVLALDWPAFGDSPAPEDPRSVSAMYYAEILSAFIDRMNLGPTILLGNSVGGYASVCLALQRPEQVRALVLVNSAGFTPPTLFSRLFVKVRGTEFITAQIWNSFPSLYIKETNSQTRRIRSRIRAAEDETRVAALAATWRSFNHPAADLRERAKDLRTPTLLIWGDRDPVIPASVGEDAATIIPGARLALLPTGHVPFAEAPAEFLQTLRPFLASLQ